MLLTVLPVGVDHLDEVAPRRRRPRRTARRASRAGPPQPTTAAAGQTAGTVLAPAAMTSGCPPGGSPGSRGPRGRARCRAPAGCASGAAAGRPSTPRAPPGRPRPATDGSIARTGRRCRTPPSPGRSDAGRRWRARARRRPADRTTPPPADRPGGHLPSWPLARRRRRRPVAPPGCPSAARTAGRVPAVAAGSSDVEAVARRPPSPAPRRPPLTGRAPRLQLAALARAAATSRSFIDVAYMSTYSWPDRSISSYMISSVIERRTNRSSSMPS